MRGYAALLVVLAASCSAFGESAERLSEAPPTPTPVATSPTVVTTAVDGLPVIVVESPPSDVEVASPLVVRGTADISEAVVHVRLTSEDGSLISGVDTTASCGDGCRGDFRVQLSFFVEARQDATLQVYGGEGADGTLIGLVEVPLTLLP